MTNQAVTKHVSASLVAVAASAALNEVDRLARAERSLLGLLRYTAAPTAVAAAQR